ncbi:MAG: trigger factor [Lachnospiraceae bacterium]|nr:trigger factor [Lachnospiraceae bacterium]
MSCTVEKLEKSMAKLTIECPAEDFLAAYQRAYQKNKGKINIAGFRKGKAPLAMIEKMYGPEMFYEDAANDLIQSAYEKAYDEADIEIVSRPTIDVTQIKKGEPFIFTATVAVKPEVTLGEYKGVEVTAQDVIVTDEEVDAEVNKALEQNAKKIDITDRAVEKDDETIIDFEGFVDGVAFDGGKGTDYPLTIGSGAFIPGFEDQIIGKNIGEEFDVNVTFPEEYHSKELAGKPAVFKCTVKSIKKKVVEEASDEFASEVSEFDTLAEYKADIKKNLEESKKKQAEQAKEDEAVQKAAANSTIDIPKPMIDSQKDQMAQDFAYRLQAQGMNMEQYFQFTGFDRAKFYETMEPQAISRIRTRLTLEEVAKAENLEVTEEDMNKEYEEMAKQYNMEVEKVKEIFGDRDKELKADLLCRKAAKLIAENAKEAKAEKKATKSRKKADKAEDNKAE